ncbi:hypothetical protein NESM_000567100 [Novymonas esmeraldas]|uniref:Uncharacterized protein n=1 Tax=Novymonas esmeraldas TaxID=1808958 RepID=A0AAW0ETE1_9TRYP
MDVRKRRGSPPAAPSQSLSCTLSKTTVTIAGVTGGGDAALPLTPAGAATSERHPPPGVRTPHRRASILDQQQPTPRGSLHWPSTHRSFSSAAATRDSSRHSQVTDRMNTTGVGVSVILSQHGRGRSSASHTPMSSHDEHSEHRSSAVSGAGGRRGHSFGRHPSAPPLVDVGDSPSFSQYSAAHSVCTTALCTPRDGPVSHGAAGTSAVKNVTAASPPPLNDFEAEAHQLTREQLEEHVEQMRATNVVLRTSVLRLRESLATLQEGMRANYADLERRQESIANTLLRRLEATKRRRGKLVAHLRVVEAEKASQEAKLHSTTQSINDLSKHLKREEQEIADRLQHRLERLHAQREQLDHVLEEQTSSLQQLEELVREVEEMDESDAADAVAATTTTTTTTTTTRAGAGTPAPVVVLASAPAAGSSGVFVPVHERSSSRMSAASSTTATTAEVAYDPTAMMRYLEVEIAAAEGLRTEALSKAEKYVATRERLERRLARERQQRAEQLTRSQALRQQLQDASAAANEKAAAQEVAMEMEMDRHLNSSRFGGDLVSSASSTCATPKLRALSTMASRGNSTSPGVGRPWPGPAVLDLDGRSHDSFLLPSSSTCSAPAGPASHADQVVGGDGSGGGGAPAGMAPASSGETAPHHLLSSSIPLNTPASRDETTVSSDGTPHTRLLVQNTSRMAPPRLVASTDTTPVASPSMTAAKDPAL